MENSAETTTNAAWLRAILPWPAAEHSPENPAQLRHWRAIRDFASLAVAGAAGMWQNLGDVEQPSFVMTDFAARRRIMVDTQVRPSDVTKFPIIDAMLSVPREIFVEDAQQETAYAGENLDLGAGRVLLEPRSLGKMLDALDITGDDLVMDIGCGYGYSAAVAARMAQAVVAVEAEGTMANEAQQLLSDAGADNAIVHIGTLAEGAAEHGPYDAIIVQGGVGEMPQAIVDQLKDGGRIIAIFMEGALGVVRMAHKSGDVLSWRFEFNASAPVLPGFEVPRVFAL